jgi:hypothetical protein
VFQYSGGVAALPGFAIRRVRGPGSHTPRGRPRTPHHLASGGPAEISPHTHTMCQPKQLA